MASKISNVLEYIFVIFLIFEYHTLYVQWVPIQSVYVIGVVILLMMLFFMPKRSTRNLFNVGFLMYLGLVILLIPININKNLFKFLLLFVGFIPLAYLYFRGNRLYNDSNYGIEWFKKYSNVITIISIVSLVFWFGSNLSRSLGNLFGFNAQDIFSPTGYMPSMWTGELNFLPSYYNIYFEAQTLTLFGYDLVRNTAIFNEGPVYNLLLCFALAIELYILKRNIFRKVILILAIITTFTTTGQLFLIMNILLYIVFSPNKKKRRILLLLLPFLLYIAYILTNSIMMEKSDTGSYVIRGESISSMISTGLANPIGGIGIMTFHGSISNSLFHVFAEGGFIMLFIYIYSMIIVPLKYYFKHKDIRWLLLYGCFFFLFIVTVTYYKCLDLTLIAYALAYSGNSHLKLKEY